MQRRKFIGTTFASGLSLALDHARAEEPPPKSRPRVCTYTEHFQSLSIPQVCKLFQQIGVDGLDLTVRPGGHIEPENAKNELPGAVQAARDHGLEIMMVTTGISAPDRHAEQIFATCQELEIDRLKLGYFDAGRFGNLAGWLDNIRRQLDAIATLAARYGVLPCVHVHSGLTIPSNGFMLYDLIRDIPPDRIGAYLDSYHMTMTGGGGGWRQAIDVLTPWISLVALKNFFWQATGRDETGQQKWRTNYCRLEDGIAPVPEFVSTIHQVGYRGFYTLHTEYRLPVDECTKLTTEDFIFLKKIFAGL
ncbi:MAG: hypothetical protein CMJ81_03025 [Planctomycetaceae bacterium]|nr:hypothetical protein [Planctomycetaceae bacterium]